MIRTMLRHLAVAAVAFSVSCVLSPQLSQAKPLTESQVPEPLKAWVPWVMHELDRNTCPFLYMAQDQRICFWPTDVAFDLTPKGGSFTYSFTVYEKPEGGQQAIVLPGSTSYWPQDVTINNAAAVVLLRDARPTVLLGAGAYTVKGNFVWDQLPVSLEIPPQVGLVALRVNGAAVAIPDIQGSQLSIQRASQEDNVVQENRVEAMVFRKITDTVPLRIETLVKLDVAGKQREESLGVVLPKSVIATEIASDIPARLERDGALRVQLRPGTWYVRLAGRYDGVQQTLTPPAANGLFDKDEIWSFEPQNHLRLVQVEGVNAIDPSQTELPQEWKAYPSYLVKHTDTLTLSEIKRGIAEEMPDQLSLNRQMWMDYSGEGITYSDTISGTIRKSTRLEVLEGVELGNASIGGIDQYITTLTEDGKSSGAGVEVREGPIQMSAGSRSKASSALSVTGWNTTFDSVSAQLYLPPGWTLFSYSGVDSVSGSWVMGWSLLDLFLVLIATVATAKLFGLRFGVLTAVGLMLIHPELRSFTSLFLVLIVLIALLRYLPEGRFRSLVRFMYRVSILVLLVVALPFMASHLREAIYPQLQSDGGHRFARGDGMDKGVRTVMPETSAAMNAPQAPMAPESVADALEEKDANEFSAREIYRAKKAAIGSGAASVLSKMAPVQQYQLYAPDTKVQTGFGTRNISENAISLRWNGSVDPTVTMHLWLISAHQNLVLALARVLLLAGLLVVLVGTQIPALREKLGLPVAAMVALITLCAMGVPSPSLAQTEVTPVKSADTGFGVFPPQELLNSLQAKLKQGIEKPAACLPECASLAKTFISVSGNTVSLLLEIHVRENVVVPLPGNVANWRPATVLVDDKPASALLVGSDGYLAVELSTGVHRVRMSGSLPASRDSIGITFPLASRYSAFDATGWNVTGIRENGVSENSIQLIRTARTTQSDDTSLGKTAIAPFYQVERTLTLANRFELTTTIYRLTPADEAAAVEVPLLAGETVTTADTQVKDGRVYVNFNPGVSAVSWQSVVAPADRIALVAPKDKPWVEIWKLSVSNLWHVKASGLPRVYEPNMATLESSNVMPVASGIWQWVPWPGEALDIDVLRPQGIEGQTRTIDESRLSITPSTRSVDTTLSLVVRSSLGGQHVITLPQDAVLGQVTKDGLTLPVQQKGNALNLPLVPGVNRFSIGWKQSSAMGIGFTVPAIDIGAPRSVNASVEITMPQNRWILFTGGPTMGPAVLFWSWIPLIALLAFGLGKTSITPLKTRHWFLLLLGMSMTSILANMVVVGWLLAMGWRRTLAGSSMPAWRFNLLQLVLVVFTFSAWSTLFASIREGLLGMPDMNITGNGSYGNLLRWYQDITASLLPTPMVVSVPVWCYRVLMLLWALWLAFSLIKWVGFAWSSFTAGGYWRSMWKSKKAVAAQTDKIKESGPTD